MTCSVIVPVLYHEPQLAETLRGLAPLRDRLDLEIILVVDVPDPARAPAARATHEGIAAEMGAVVEYRIGQRGFGSALRQGFTRASGEVVIPFMADASDDSEDVLRLVQKVGSGWDVVVGSRYMPGGRVVGNTTKQRLSALYSWLVRLAGGPKIHDVSNAFKAYRRSVLESIETEADSFDVSVELTLKAARAGFRIGEIPTVWMNRRQGRSKFKLGREIRSYGRWLTYVLQTRALSKRRAKAMAAKTGRT
jgi:glycosyltransferase involved in cell wall biosynthesis